MRNLLRFEWSRGISSKGFKLSFAISLLLVLLDFRASYLLNQVGGMTKYPEIFLSGFIVLDYQFIYMGLLHPLLPVLAALPYGSSYFKDQESGYIKNVRLKSSSRQYHLAKYLVAFVLGALVITVPLLLSLMLSMTYLPILPPEPFAYQGYVRDGSFLSGLFYCHPVLYGISIAIMEGLFGGLFAAMSLCISRYVNYVFSVLVIPFVAYIVEDSICAILHLEHYCYFCLLDPVLDSGMYVVLMLGLGMIVINDQVLHRDISFPESIGALIENPSFLEEYSGRKNLELLNRLNGNRDQEAVSLALERVCLQDDADKLYGRYSLGMKQKLGIAYAILNEPDIIVLDEPINALDEDSVAHIRKTLYELRDSGRLILIACHDREEMDYLADEIFVMSEGRVIRKERNDAHAAADEA